MDRGDPTGGTDSQQIEASLLQPHAFAALFHRHAGSVHRYLVKRVGPQDAEDLVGETFATAFRARTSYDLSRPDARPWLFGIATNLAHHYWRSEGRRKKRDAAISRGAIVEDLSEEATSTAFFSSQEELIAQALARLDDAHLDVLFLVAGPGLTYEEVSHALGIPVGTVRSRLFRARYQLRELLGGPWQYLEGEPPTERASIATEGTQ
jgi:RNA polymerase sigma factor (sigma-70 family)